MSLLRLILDKSKVLKNVFCLAKTESDHYLHFQCKNVRTIVRIMTNLYSYIVNVKVVQKSFLTTKSFVFLLFLYLTYASTALLIHSIRWGNRLVLPRPVLPGLAWHGLAWRWDHLHHPVNTC